MRTIFDIRERGILLRKFICRDRVRQVLVCGTRSASRIRGHDPSNPRSSQNSKTVAICITSNTDTMTTPCQTALRPILIPDGSNQGGKRRRLDSSHHVHFEPHLSWQEEELRSQRGQALRQKLRQQLLVERARRCQDHQDRKRAFDILRSTDHWNIWKLQDLLQEDAASTNSQQFFTRGLQAMLVSLGAPGHLHSNVLQLLEWFRYSCPLQHYSKQLRCDYEFIDSYLLYLGRTHLFQKRFVHPTVTMEWHPQPSLLDSSTQNCTSSTTSPPISCHSSFTSSSLSSEPPALAPLATAESSTPDWLLDSSTEELEDSEPSILSNTCTKEMYTAHVVGRKADAPPSRGHGAKYAWRRALHFLWWTLTRAKRSGGPMLCGLVDVVSWRNDHHKSGVDVVVVTNLSAMTTNATTNKLDSWSSSCRTSSSWYNATDEDAASFVPSVLQGTYA